MGKNEPPRLTLQVPEPPARPGDKPDFSYLKLAPAGSVDRPPVHASAAQMHDYAYSLVRVLDDAGNAVGPWAPQVDAELLRTGLRAMMKTRVVRYADATGAAAEESIVLYAVPRRRSDCRGARARARAGRHVLSQLSAAGLSDRAWHAAGRHDVSDSCRTRRIRSRAASCR